MNAEIQAYRDGLHCSVQNIDDIFEECVCEAKMVMSLDGIKIWLKGANRICGLGRGTDLVLIFLEGMPEVVKLTDESIIVDVVDIAETLSSQLLGPAIKPFLSTLPSVARRLGNTQLLREWLKLVSQMADEAKEGLIALLNKVIYLLNQLSIGGLKNWIEYGIRVYRNQPHRFDDFFSLQTADAHAMLQRERHGTLYIDYERQLKLYLRAFWEVTIDFRPYSLAFDTLRKPTPHLDKLGIHLPDVYDDLDGIKGIDRYRAMIAHTVAHKLWSKPYLADNFSTFQHLTVETFEDARIEALAISRYPGLRKLWLSLHPLPKEGGCPEGYSCIRHKLAMLSRALLEPAHPYTDPVLLDFVKRFHKRIVDEPYNTNISTELGVAYLAKINEHDFRKPKVWFEDTQVSYRDDNRYLWLFLEDTDDEDDFHSDHGATNHAADDQQEDILPPQHYPEWDYQTQNYRPDWATVYEGIQSPGDPNHIDKLLEKHQLLAKRLKKIVDLLKPQQRKRVRYQEEGDELDLDVVIRAMTDFYAGTIPDTHIHQSYVRDGRNIAVLLLLDLSESINETPEGSDISILQLSQEAVSLLAWAVEALGDSFAIAGFASNTRHEVRYTHFKGFQEPWGELPKSRLAAMQAGYSTRMGAALRHAGRYLEPRREEKKLMLVLSDGEPSDIDVLDDARYLRDDTHEAVDELESKGITTYCITLDPNADEYVADVFGANHYTVIDKLERLPEKLPQLFMALTR
ncbi:VWA domain-containing protein [Candidatus Parabeggiatoa sp. HSG14]|uniref:nitric oxide reductase activation protein NorD n=1 Tax=Candidatus Parabeggiatoa sp. HSG14 TaxID=3055593 RepID=UPI0025A92992|nr:VWA domain-containing protein [Thiotrichales bacterium HSG14]